MKKEKILYEFNLAHSHSGILRNLYKHDWRVYTTMA